MVTKIAINNILGCQIESHISNDKCIMIIKMYNNILSYKHGETPNIKTTLCFRLYKFQL
jgi:hypothetical protein